MWWSSMFLRFGKRLAANIATAMMWISQHNDEFVLILGVFEDKVKRQSFISTAAIAFLLKYPFLSSWATFKRRLDIAN